MHVIGEFGFLVTTLGEVMVGISVYRVHSKMGREHKIDKAVEREITQEKYIVIAGIALIILGALLELNLFI